MELKPINEKNEVLYPTIQETSKSNIIENMTFSTAFNIRDYENIPNYVATTSYVCPRICSLIRVISIFITVLSAIMLFINKMNINKLIEQEETEEKIAELKKKRKIKWRFFYISIAIIIITSIVIVYFENKM